jgi:hypothetical protein
LAAGPLLAQTEPNKSPSAKRRCKPPTVQETGKKPLNQAPPPVAAPEPTIAPNTHHAAAKPQVVEPAAT